MHKLTFNYHSMNRLSFVLLVMLFISLASVAQAANSVTLKVYQGYRFSDKAITKSGDKQNDLSFYVNMGRQGARSFALGALGGAKIKEFGNEKPDAKTLTPQVVSGWKSYANAPSPGFYVVQGADGKSLYLIEVKSFKNQGKASAYWELTFTWEKF